MPMFNTGDIVIYSGEHLKRSQTGIIKSIKVLCSEATKRPIYYIIWSGDTDIYQYGIHEHNLTLLKKVAPDWEV